MSQSSKGCNIGRAQHRIRCRSSSKKEVVLLEVMLGIVSLIGVVMLGIVSLIRAVELEAGRDRMSQGFHCLRRPLKNRELGFIV